MLTLLAPFTWKNVVTSRPATWNTPARRVGPVAPPNLARTVPLGAPPVEVVSASQAEESQLTEFVPPPNIARLDRPEPAVREISHEAPSELSEYFAPRHQAVLAPPVASQVPLRTPERTTEPTGIASSTVLPANQVLVVSSRANSQVLPQRPREIPQTPTSWPKAVSLIEQFRALQQVDETRSWAAQAITTLEDMHRQSSLDGTDVLPLLNGLSNVTEQGISLAENASSPEMRNRIRHAGYATIRRDLLWRQVHLIATADVSEVPVISSQEMKDHLQAIRVKIGSDANAMAWRKYLRLDALQACLNEADANAFIALAVDVLARMDSPKLTSAQRKVLRQSPFSDLHHELRQSVVKPIDYPRLLDDMEFYENTRSAEAAHRIATTCQMIRRSDNENLAKLAEILDQHYRNANLRVAVRDDLLNRLLPQQEDFEDEINENIVGAYVYGSAWGTVQMRTVLIPDQSRWRFGLEVEGVVESQTTADRKSGV